MILRFNPSGTHVHKERLKIRLELYSGVGDKTYAVHYVDKFDRDPTEEEMGNAELLSLVPTHQEQNPAINIFVTVPETFSLEDISGYLEVILKPDDWVTLDNYLVVPDGIHYISPFIRSKPKLTGQKITTRDIEDLLASTNEKIKDVSLELTGSGKIINLEKQSIDMGADPIYRASYNNGETYIDGNNPNNADGTFDTVEIYFATFGGDATDVKVGAGYGTAPDFQDRDYEYLGTVPNASKQTFSGLDIDGQTGDYAMFYWDSGYIQADSTGGTTCYYISGDKFGTGSNSYSTSSKQAHSCYLTGTESGGETEKLSSESGAGQDTRPAGSPAAAAVGTETGLATEAKAGYPGAEIDGAESGAAGEASLLNAIAAPAGDSGSGLESSALETPDIVTKSSSDNGAGSETVVAILSTLTTLQVGSGSDNIEGRELLSTEAGSGVEAAERTSVWIVADSGSGTEAAAVIPVFGAGDTGSGADLSTLFKGAQSGDIAGGVDALKALVGAAVGLGSDMRLARGSGRVKMASKKARMPSKGVNI